MSKDERSISASRFKAECLAILDEVAETGQPLVVTKRGRPVVRLIAVNRLKPGSLKGTVKILGDIVGSLDVEWDAAK